MAETEDIYQEYNALVNRFVLRLCKNQDLADEITQETFYRAIKGWPSFHNQSSVPTWLCAIAKNLYYEALRKPQPLPLCDNLPDSQHDFAEQLVRKDQVMTAQKQLHNLPEPYREVFTLRTFCELSHAQIGQLFGKSDQWARVTYYRARKMLADGMEETK